MVLLRVDSLRISSVAVLLFLMVSALPVVSVTAQKAGDASWLTVDKMDWHADQKRFAITQTSSTTITPTLTFSNKKSEAATMTSVEVYFNPTLTGKFTWTGSENVDPGASANIQVILQIDKAQTPGDYNVGVRVLVSYSGVQYLIDCGKVDSITIYSAGGGAPGFPWESIVAGLVVGIIVIVSRRKNDKIPFVP